mgnify:CR=1 FL=1
MFVSITAAQIAARHGLGQRNRLPFVSMGAMGVAVEAGTGKFRPGRPAIAMSVAVRSAASPRRNWGNVSTFTIGFRTAAFTVMWKRTNSNTSFQSARPVTSALRHDCARRCRCSQPIRADREV